MACDITFFLMSTCCTYLRDTTSTIVYMFMYITFLLKQQMAMISGRILESWFHMKLSHSSSLMGLYQFQCWVAWLTLLCIIVNVIRIVHAHFGMARENSQMGRGGGEKRQKRAEWEPRRTECVSKK